MVFCGLQRKAYKHTLQRMNLAVIRIQSFDRKAVLHTFWLSPTMHPIVGPHYILIHEPMKIISF